MIKNERQYRITKAQADKFREALDKLNNTPNEDNQIHPLIRKAQTDGLKSQLGELEAELEDYDALRSGKRKVLELTSFEELPTALIRARIASGLSQKDLADKLGLKEQQIQRYEATDYESASVARVIEIAQALGIKIREDVFLSGASISARDFLRNIKMAGLEDKLIINRILPPELVDAVEIGETDTAHIGNLIMYAATALNKIFGWSPNAIFEGTPLQLRPDLAGITRFKVGANAEESYLALYTIYAYYLAQLALRVTRDTPPVRTPMSSKQLRAGIIERYGELNFEAALNYMWDLGIPVLPLDDPGAFHGACWRIEGRNVIVLKQKTSSVSRWLFDLLHEAKHTSEEPDQIDFSVIEESETSPERRHSELEQEASQYAGDVLLDNRAEELAKLCTQRCKKEMRLLKSAVEQVAHENNVSVDALANYMAFRLSLEGQNWWATAANLQSTEGSPVEIARQVFFQRADLSQLGDIERRILVQALAEVEGVKP